MNTTVERPDGISLYVVTPPPRATGSRSGALEGRRFAPCDSISWQHSGAITLRRAARKGPFCIIPLQIGDSTGCSRTEIRLAVLEGIQEAISVDRSHPLDAFAVAASAAFRTSAHPKCQCVHAMSPSRFQSFHAGKFPNVRTMPSNFSCPVRRRRQGETLKGGRIRSAVTRTARA